MLSTAAVGMRAGIARNAAVAVRVQAFPLVRSRLPVLALRSNAILQQQRNVQYQSIPADKSDDITNSQRIKRPSSPHFTIYQPQLTWIPSIFNRFTGEGMSIALYAFAIGYLASPVIGIPIDSAHLVEFVGSLPVWAKYGLKALFAYPFAFHSFNGVRHLAWDMGWGLSVKATYATGYTVLALTAIGGTAFIFM